MVTSSFFDSSFNTSFTFFIVESRTNTSVEVTTSNQGLGWYSGSWSNSVYANTNNLSSTQTSRNKIGSMTLTDPKIETFRYNGSQATLRFSNYPTTTSVTGNLGLSGTLTIGSLSTNTYYLHGDIAEIIIYNSSLSDVQIDQIESYLTTKYNITPAIPLTSIPLFIFEGDSMTSGIGATGGQTYPVQVQNLLGLTATYQNLGVGGQTVLDMTNDAATQIDPLYSSPRTTNIISLLGGTNDLYFGADATTTYNRIVSYLQTQRTTGYKVIVNTILPRSNAGTPVDFETNRQTINTLIRSNWTTFADGISDVASDSIIGPVGAELNTTYYPDAVHLTNAGYGIVASYVTAAIKQIMNPIAISSVSVTPSATTTAISWTTNQTGSSKVNYGLTSSYGSSTTETDTTTRVLSHTSSLSGLTACTTYHFQAVSNDLNGNQAVSTDQSFKTLGCLPDTPTSLQQNQNGSTVVFKFNMSSANSSDSLIPQIEIQRQGTAFTNTPTHTGSAVSYTGTAVEGSITIPSLGGGNYHWQARVSNSAGQSSWVSMGGNPDFSIEYPASSAPSCNDSVPGVKAPWVYGAAAEDSGSIKLSFTKNDNPVDKYVLEYGTKSGSYQYGVDNMGVTPGDQMTFLVKSLAPDTTYYFRVRAGNGCATGAWSNEISAKTKSLVSRNQLNITSSELVSLPNTEKPAESQTDNTNNPSTPAFGGYDVKVKVLDDNKKPVEGATVTLHSNPQTTKTNKDGIAEFSNVESGDHKVLIAYNGFQGEQSINLTGDVKEFDLNITIKPQNVLLSPVVIIVVSILAIVIIILGILLIRSRKK